MEFDDLKKFIEKLILKKELKAQINGHILYFKKQPKKETIQTQSQQVIIQAPESQMSTLSSKEANRIQEILDGLDERLALGEISEEIYYRLYNKWKKKLG